MSANPYAPPKSEVADVASTLAPRPPLWNPWAATLWSILFSPAFGSFLHMKNWQALGDAQKAKTQKSWFVGIVVALVLITGASVALPDSKALDAVSRVMSLPLLIGWYYSGGKAQRAHIEARFGQDYPRRGWLKPIGFVLLAFVGLMVFAVIVGFTLGATGAA